MISRTTNADRPEPLQQGSLTGMRGIDYTKPITANNVVNDMRNLTVNTDGTLSIRKPLIAKRTYTNTKCSAIKVIPLYDSSFSLIVYEDNSFSIEDAKGVKYPVSFHGEYVNYSGTFEITSVTNTVGVYDVSDFINILNVNSVNTTSNTILGNITVDLTSKKLEALYSSNVVDTAYAKEAPRYLTVVKESTVPVSFKVTIKTPEINTLNTGSDLILDPNMSLDNPYAIRDMYNSRYVSVDGILPYTHCESKDKPTKIATSTSKVETDTVNTTLKYTTKFSNILNAAPPYSPTPIEFSIDTKAFSGYSDDYDFYCYGGSYKIWFNKFVFNNTFTKNISHTLCSLKPDSVSVKYTATVLGTTNATAVEAQIAEPYGVKGGYKLSNTTKFLNNAIQGNSTEGYYVNINSVPVLHHLIAGHLDTLNGVYHYNSNNYKTSRPEYSGSLSFNGISKAYDYTCTTVQDDGYYRFYGGKGVVDLTIEVTPTYKILDKTLKYTSKTYINIFKHFKSDYESAKSALITPWFDDFSPISGNYPAHTFVESAVETDDFNIESIASSVDTKTPSLGTFSTSVKTTFLNTEQAVFAKVSKTATSYAEYERTSLDISYTEGTCTYTVKSDVNVTLENYSPSVTASVSVNLNGTSLDTSTLSFKQNTFTATSTIENSFSNPTVSVSAAVTEGGVIFENITKYTVKEITERKQFPKFQLTDVLKADSSNMVLLKAFMNLKSTSDVKYYGVWEYSKDGVDWTTYYADSTDAAKLESKGYFKKLKLPKYTVSESGDITTSEDTTLYSEVYGIPFTVEDENDIAFIALDANADVVTNSTNIAYVVPKRADILLLQNLADETVAASYCIPVNVPIQAVQLKFTVCSVSETDSDTVNVLAAGVFTPNTGLKWEFADTDLGNSVMGAKLYYKNTIFSYGHSSFNCNVLASDVGSFITPISRIIDISSNAEDVVTALVPWRDYVAAFTEQDVHLISSVDNGFYTKTVSTFIGVPTKDRRTCKSILNGIVFKSGNKFYSLYPNYTSSDESILNLNEISSPIDHILENLKFSNYDCFSISTNSAYYTFIPFENYTLCVIYNYDNKAWQIYEYNGVRIVDYTVDNVDNIYLYGYCNGVYTEYYFDKYLHEAMPKLKAALNLTTFDEIPYGDYTTLASLNPSVIGELPQCTPIVFKLDTGQRVDNISTTKQFVETKVILATQSEKPASNLKIDVYVDGTPVKTRTKGGGIFYKTSPSQVLTFGDVVVNNSDSVLDTVSQAYLKYSGKGKTVRHVIEGESLYDFKLYELFYRYRIMPNKP